MIINKSAIIERFHNRLDEARSMGSFVKSRGTPKTKAKRRRLAASNQNDAALKRAGLNRAKSRGMPRETILARSGENEMTTTVTTHKTPENFIRANLPKVSSKGEKLSTTQRALVAKRLKRQIQKAGGGSKSKVHDPEITSNLPAKSSDIEMTDAKQRARNLRKAAKDIPSNIKTSGGKPGDVVSGHPSNPNDSWSSSGKRAREKIYATIPGAPKKRDPITGKMIGVIKK